MGKRKILLKMQLLQSWWDYGYWISTLGERKTLADNSTLIDWQIRKIASTLFSTPDNAWQILVSDTETDASSYYVTLPSDINKPTRHGDDVFMIKIKKNLMHLKTGKMILRQEKYTIPM